MIQPFVINEQCHLGMNPSKTGLNNNIALIGTPGSGKTHLTVYNIMQQCDRSHIVVDCKGNLTGLLDYYQKQGYQTYHLNLLDLDHSDTYDMFEYIDSENVELDTLTLAQTLYGESAHLDPFWDESAKRLLSFIMLMIYELYPEGERDFTTSRRIIDLLNEDDNKGRVKKSDASKIEKIAKVLKKVNKNSKLEQYCKTLMPTSADRTVDCILASLLSHMNSLFMKKTSDLISTKGIDFTSFLEQKTFLLITINDADTSLHSICGTFLTQLFQFLYKHARTYGNGKLKVMTQFTLDDFGSYYIKDFASIIATARSRNINLLCLFQSQAQLKDNYRVAYETIIQCFDTILFFGGLDFETRNLIQKCSGYCLEYIHTQKNRTTYLIRRGEEVQLLSVKDLSDFEVLATKNIRKTYIRRINQENDELFDKEDIKRCIKKFEQVHDDKTSEHRIFLTLGELNFLCDSAAEARAISHVLIDELNTYLIMASLKQLNKNDEIELCLGNHEYSNVLRVIKYIEKEIKEVEQVII